MFVCFGSPVQLNGSGGTNYTLSPATWLSEDDIANPIAVITVTDNYDSSDTVTITVLPEAKLFAGNDTTAGVNQPLQLPATDVNNTGFTNFTWSPALGLNETGCSKVG